MDFRFPPQLYFKKKQPKYYIDISAETLPGNFEALLTALAPFSPLGVTLWALYTRIWMHVLLCRFSATLSGWTVAGQTPSKVIRDGFLLHSCAVLAVCLGSLSCWKVKPWPSLRSEASGSGFHLLLSALTQAWAVFLSQSLIYKPPPHHATP